MVILRCKPEIRRDIIQRLLDSGSHFSDVQLHARGGRSFPAHRLILGSSSRVILALLSQAEIEPEGADIYLPDYGADEVEELLDFVYGTQPQGELTSELGRLLGLGQSPKAVGKRKVESLDRGTPSKRVKDEPELSDPDSLEDFDASDEASVGSDANPPSPTGGAKVETKSSYWSQSECLQLLVNSYATLNLEWTSPLAILEFESQSVGLETEAAFRALIGLRQLEDGSLEGQALAYSHPKQKAMKSQFEAASEAMRQVSGLSEGHFHYQPSYFLRQGLKVPKIVESLRNSLRGRMEPFSNSQIEKIIGGDKIQCVLHNKKFKSLPDLDKTAAISVAMTDDIPPDQVDDIIMVYFHAYSKKIFFKQLELYEKDYSQSADLWVRTLFDVWACGSSSIIPKSPFLVHKFHSVSEPMTVYSAAQSLLDGREVQCPDCQETFSLTTSKEEEAYQDHKRNHEVEKFTCDCNVVVTSNVDKIKHIKLAHSNGKFIKCEDCEFIGIEAEVNEHRTKQHQTFICDVCATVSQNLAKHKIHIKKHVPIKCKDCPEEFIGKANLLEHRTKVHGDRFPCKWCGKVFSATWKLKTHITGAHATPRFMCDLCGQEFRLKTTMYRHKISVHIKNRPFVCRYGCGADYNDECNLRTHEKKTHGAAFQGSSFNHIYKNL